MTKTKTNKLQSAADDGLPDPIEPPAETDDEGWSTVDEPLIDRRMATYTLRLARRDVERLRAVADKLDIPATTLMRTWVLEALAGAESDVDLGPQEEIDQIRINFDRAMRHLEMTLAKATRSATKATPAVGRKTAKRSPSARPARPSTSHGRTVRQK